MHRTIAILLTSLFIALGFLSTADAAQRRVALVIGNSTYRHAALLKNPKNDAQKISQKLKKLGFDVIMGIDLEHRQFARIISTFKRKLAFSDVALFFYAGHGLQINGRNYLMPVDAQLDDETSLDFEAVKLNTIVRLMERQQRINIVLLDACRDNPIARNLTRSMGTRSASVGRGLAPVKSGVGTLIAYATQPGNIALDGDNANSPFTRSLIKHIATPALDVALMMRRVRQDVIRETGGRQVPWQHSSLTTPFVFNEQAIAKAPQTIPKAPLQTSSKTFSSSPAIELAFWQSAKEQGTREAYEAYVQKFPNGNFSLLAKIKLQQFQRTASLSAKPAPSEPIKRSVDVPQAANDPSQEKPQNIADGELARALQIELTRVGCKPGKIDGQWGRQGKKALDRFNKKTGLSLLTDTPSQKTINTLKIHKRNSCKDPGFQKRQRAKLKINKIIQRQKKATKKKTARVTKGKRCKYEPMGACKDRVCSILAARGDCTFVNPAAYCKKGGKYRKKKCK